jgi:dephospho-CoA kinase
MRAAGHSFGLTGGVASGKSTVARFFAELGAKVIDADGLGHELIRAPLPGYQKVVGCFGTGILDPAGEIDRKRLGAIVFASPQKLLELNAILHPRIIERVGELSEQYHTQDPAAVVLVDAALIYEAGMEGRFRKMLVAWCRPDQQVERVMAKAAVSRQEAERRIATQMPSEEKRRRADYVIDCSGTKENTRAQVQTLYQELRRLVEKNEG